MDERLDVLRAAILAAGGAVVGTLVQRRGVSRATGPGGARRLYAPVHPATLFGSGKVEELKRMVEDLHAELVVVANPLKSSQTAELEARVGCKIDSPNQTVQANSR